MNTERCPICNLKTSQTEIHDGYNIYNCNNCGRFEINPSALSIIEDNYNSNKHLLAGYLFERSNKKNLIIIDSSTVSELMDSAGTPLSPFEKIDKLLLYIYKNSKFLNHGVRIDYESYPLCYAYNEEEFEYIIKKAEGLNYVEGPIAYEYYLSLDGWKRIEQLLTLKINSNQAFVAMWFHDDMKKVYTKALVPALKATGYNPIKIDEIQHNGKIDDRIMSEIRKSSLLVADFSGHRGGVYFEAGFALGLGIPVIWTCRDSHKNELHFDTRQYNHIIWKDIKDLKKQLIDRIEGSGLSKLLNNSINQI